MNRKELKAIKNPPPQEIIIYTRSIKDKKYLPYRANSIQFVELVDDGSVVFKRYDYPRERAAYIVDKILGFGLVPPTIIRKVDGEIGSAQEFIPDAKFIYDVPNKEIYDDQLFKMWIFDYIIWNTDRHQGNFVIKGDRLYTIDHGLAFEDEGKYPPYSYGKFFDKKIPESIVEIFRGYLADGAKKKALSDLLRELLDDKKVKACLARIDHLADLVINKGFITRKDISHFKKPTRYQNIPQELRKGPFK